MPKLSIVGVFDPDRSHVGPVAAKAGCRGFSDYRKMCASAKPDFAFTLGRHSEMAELARFLIDQRIRFALEKPCAINAAEAADIAARAAAAGVFAAVPYVFRKSPLAEAVPSDAGAVQYAMLKFIAGLVDRYREQGVGCIIDRKIRAVAH